MSEPARSLIEEQHSLVEQAVDGARDARVYLVEVPRVPTLHLYIHSGIPRWRELKTNMLDSFTNSMFNFGMKNNRNRK